MLNLLVTTNGNNDGKYSSTEYDSIMDKAKTLTDKAAYYDAMHEAEQLALKDAAIAPLAFVKFIFTGKSLGRIAEAFFVW